MTCGGHCCRRFTLPFSPEEGWAEYRAKAKRSCGFREQKGSRYYVDIEVMMPLLVYLGWHPTNPATMTPQNKMLHHYTCKALDKESGLCTIYERRPKTCRTYPDGEKCNYADCQWKAAREGRVSRHGEEY